MAQNVSKAGHKRKKTLVFDPSQKQKDDNGEVINRKKRVAAYARVSTELDSQQNSYEAQIEYYSNYIKNNAGWEFVEVYADEGITGTSYKHRDGFNRMVADATDGKIDLILTKSISRFARNTVDALTITRQLKSKGIEVFFEKENISSMDNQAELIFTIMSSIAQEESRSISENVRWGLQRSMEAGKVYLPWKVFMGYEKGPDGLPQINEEEAVIVRKIYRAFLDGTTLREIARSLDAMGVKTPFDKGKWSAETVRHILTNEKYKGDAVLQKTYTVDFLSKVVKPNHGERRQWYIQDSHDAIISPETFKLVQEELMHRNGHFGRYYDSPFTWKVYCGKCGAFYGHRHWDLTKENTLDKWVCGPCYKKDPDGDVIMLKERDLQKAFLIALNRVASDYEWSEDEYKQGFIPLFADSEKVKLDEVNPSEFTFNAHAWHVLVEYAKISPDRTMSIKFRNGRKETVNLKDIG